jgi:hypothetical protein
MNGTRMRLKLVPFFRAGLAASALLVTPAVQAQTGAAPLAVPSVRVTAPVVNEALVTLKGNTSPMAQARYDRGAASTSLPTGRLQLLLKRSPAQEVALRQYLGGLGDPNSPNYRKWLTPESYGANFGIANEDLQAVETWLESQGFKIESVPASRNLIQFSGTTGQVAQAFHTSIHSYVINEVQHYSNAKDPQIPAALAPVITGISPLNDFHSKPMHVLGPHSQVINKDGRLQVMSQLDQGVSPQITIADSHNVPYLYLTPADAATIYDAPNSQLNPKYKGSAQWTGAGISIGLAGDSDIPVADYLNYRKLFLNESAPVSPTVVVDGVDPGTTGNALEGLLDMELAGGLAPQAKIYYYESNSDLLQDGVYDAALRAVEDNNVAILNVSYGNCEVNEGVAGNAQINALWQQAAAQGITVVVSAGDTGSAGCDLNPGETQATGSLAVNGLASTPYNIAVGGTDFDVLPLNFTQYVSGASNGGTSPYYGSALGYIPENPWNESISNNPPGNYNANTAKQYPYGANSALVTILAAGGGGYSSSVFCSGVQNSNGSCSVPLTGYLAPSFQSGINVGSTAPAGVRYLPDISLFASSGSLHQATWAFCGDSTVEGLSTPSTDCAKAADGSFSLFGVGGTSAATPAVAGALAMVLQSLGGSNQRLGLANNVIYNLHATNSNSASIFHDITAGNNSVPCRIIATDPNCGSSSFLNGFNAGTGYDLATGLGSIDISQLVNAWDSATFAPTRVSLTAAVGTGAPSNAPISIVHGTAITLTAAVTPGSATGTVSVTGPAGLAGEALNQNIPLPPSGGIGTVSVADFPGGTYNIQAYYQGDVKDAPSTSTAIPVTVTPEASSPNLSLAIVDVNTGNTISQNPIPYGAYGFASVQPANSNGATSHGVATGTATLLNNGLAQTQTLSSQGVADFPLYDLAPGSYNLSASYSGDNSYLASGPTAGISLVISKGLASLTVHTGTASTAATASRNITVELDTDSDASTAPSGPVTLTVNGTAFTTNGTKGSSSNGAVATFATFAVPNSTLQAANKLSASYGGDTNYNGSTAASCTFTPGTVASAAGSGEGLLLAFGSTSALCSVLFFCVPAQRRAWRSLLVVLFAVGLMGAAGCGSTSNGTNSIPLFPTCSQ